MSAIKRRLKLLEARLAPRAPTAPLAVSVWFYPTRDRHCDADRAAAVAHLGTPIGPRIIVGMSMPHLPASTFGRPAVRTVEELHGLAS